MWYSDVPGTTPTKVEKLALAKQGATNTYFLATEAFYPWDNDGWVAQEKELAVHAYNDAIDHNFGFTSEVRYWFEYAGDESLTFSGDDDVWVFIAGKLALDLGGLHPQRSASFVLDAAKATELGLEVGLIYEAALFHAERHTDASNFNLTLGGFASEHSECATLCGDGIVAGDEVCDDGVNDGKYGHCLPGCTGRGPHCGDGTVQPEGGEACDEGINLTVWSPTGAPECAPGCVFGSYCGDGAIDGLFGEECDESIPTAACTQDCSLGERCGDGKVQQGDGNTVSGDGCDSTCQYEVPI
jgi:fibro-slime domain-containing protein